MTRAHWARKANLTLGTDDRTLTLKPPLPRGCTPHDHVLRLRCRFALRQMVYPRTRPEVRVRSGAELGIQYRCHFTTVHHHDRNAAEQRALAKTAKRVHNVPCPKCGRMDAQAFAARRRTHALVFVILMIALGATRNGGQWSVYMAACVLALATPALIAAFDIVFALCLLDRNGPNRGPPWSRPGSDWRAESTASVSSGDKPEDAPAGIDRRLFFVAGGVAAYRRCRSRCGRPRRTAPRLVVQPGCEPRFRRALGSRLTLNSPVRVETINRSWRGQPRTDVDEPGRSRRTCAIGRDRVG